ncbi:hypothetical protein ACIA5C_22950 [Actinoplanes sp. NPDC051343]|uniref:hypothetical protein n=1 Tax=Actinoplanes sp. NPDC051343 TaxID=3363906 RepID=UPI0037B13CFC
MLPDMSDRAAKKTDTDKAPSTRRAPGHRAPEDEEDTVVPSPAADEAAASSGRHTVPDELVKAATYRLPPDRVFRAKVRDTTTPSADDPTTKLVPKPRQS